MYVKKLEDMNLIDNYLFMEIAQYGEKGEEACRLMLEIIFDRPIRKITVEAQKVMTARNNLFHAIRVDALINEQEEAYAKISDVPPEIFDIEMERADSVHRIEALPERSRYYHAVIDRELLKSGEEYHFLKKAYVIFIMEKDPFGKGLMWYTAQNSILEDQEIPYDDGSVTLYLYTKGKDNKGRQKLKELLQYIENSVPENVTNQTISRIHTIASEIKEDEEVKKGFMKWWEYDKIIQEDAREEGLKEGIKEGEFRKLISLVCAKLAKNQSVSQIAEALEEEETNIEHICEVADQYAPEYNIEKIYQKLIKKDF